MKPPFRYLHDIFVATIQATGFGNGIYDEAEMDTKANHDKDTKINILAKMITLTEMIVGEKLDVKPSKIVAGLEPDKTNYFLQRLFQASTAGIDSTPYVKKIMGGDDGGDDEEQEKQAQIEAQRQAEEAQR